MSSVELVPATAELMQKFYGRQLPVTVHAVVAVRGDEVLGVGGYMVIDGYARVFAEMKDEARRYAVSIMRAARQVLRMASESGLPIDSFCDENIARAREFLIRLGFTKSPDGSQRWIL